MKCQRRTGEDARIVEHYEVERYMPRWFLIFPVGYVWKSIVTWHSSSGGDFPITCEFKTIEEAKKTIENLQKRVVDREVVASTTDV